MEAHSTERITVRDFRQLLESGRHPKLNCPACGQSWLIVGVRRHETHACKACGHRFHLTASLREGAGEGK
ncbi:MAG TPA: hypothetical protein VGB76_04965 [Pyrinomonadaceae bacterium]